MPHEKIRVVAAVMCLQPTHNINSLKLQLAEEFQLEGWFRVYTPNSCGGNWSDNLAPLLHIFQAENFRLEALIVGRHSKSACYACKHGLQTDLGEALRNTRIALTRAGLESTPVFTAKVHDMEPELGRYLPTVIPNSYFKKWGKVTWNEGGAFSLDPYESRIKVAERAFAS